LNAGLPKRTDRVGVYRVDAAARDPSDRERATGIDRRASGAGEIRDPTDVMIVKEAVS
jgi:hypothetical protein